jgi:hypothetical protein
MDRISIFELIHKRIDRIDRRFIEAMFDIELTSSHARLYHSAANTSLANEPV